MTPIERRFDAIHQIGCIITHKAGKFAQAQIHHLNLGGRAGQKRRGDRYTIGLTPWYHDGIVPLGETKASMTRRFGPSLKYQSKAFRERFGSDDELLAYQDQLIEELEARVA